MTRIAFVGCGKLGLPVATAWASKGHDVVGYDVSPHAREIMASRKYPHLEPGMQRLLDEGVQVKIVDSIAEAVAHADLVFVAVQTPHGPEYEGITRMPAETADFGYGALKAAVFQIADASWTQQKHITLVVISTVLPGTSERELLPLVDHNQFVSFTYSPLFIAQSTVVEDTFNPEFVLLGVDKSDARGVEEVKAFFESMHPPEKLRFMSVASAEACKVAYNTTLGQKLVNANAWMEICEKTGANVDDVMGALKCATDRIVSPKYMNAGMGDGGGCFIKGEKIYAERGLVPIDEIVAGERVLGSDGEYHVVIDTYKRPYKGPVLTFHSANSDVPSFTVTPEHIVYVATGWTTLLKSFQFCASSPQATRAPSTTSTSPTCTTTFAHVPRAIRPREMPARFVRPGDNAWFPGKDAKVIPILRIVPSSYEGTVYNLNVADVHDYVCAGGAVQNCHPRDMIALSHLAERLDLSYDLGGELARAREAQTEWLVDLAIAESNDGKLPIVVLGKAYKRGTNLTVGSPAILLASMLREYPHLQVSAWDPHVDRPQDMVVLSSTMVWPAVSVFVVATDHDEFYAMKFPAGSIVIDPWGKMRDQDGVKVVRVGRR